MSHPRFLGIGSDRCREPCAYLGRVQIDRMEGRLDQSRSSPDPLAPELYRAQPRLHTHDVSRKHHESVSVLRHICRSTAQPTRSHRLARYSNSPKASTHRMRRVEASKRSALFNPSWMAPTVSSNHPSRLACVSRVYTDLPVFLITPDGLVVRNMFGLDFTRLSKVPYPSSTAPTARPETPLNDISVPARR